MSSVAFISLYGINGPSGSLVYMKAMIFQTMVGCEKGNAMPSRLFKDRHPDRLRQHDNFFDLHIYCQGEESRPESPIADRNGKDHARTIKSSFHAPLSRQHTVFSATARDDQEGAAAL
jgi:hypothetical protein